MRVSLRTFTARVRRQLAKEGMKLIVSKSNAEKELGDYLIVNLTTNSVESSGSIDILSSYLKPYETLGE